MIKNNMTKEDWENVDKKSRFIFQKFLEKFNAQNIEHSTGNCCYDIRCENLLGEKIGFEIKDRKILSTTYNDHLIETLKSDACNKRIEQSQFKRVIAVSFFKDNVFVMSDINDPERKIQNKWCFQTTEVKGAKPKRVLKECIILPQKVIYKFEQTNDGFNFTRIK